MRLSAHHVAPEDPHGDGGHLLATMERFRSLIPQLTGANTTGLGRDTRSGCSRPTLPVGRADHPVNLAALA